MPLSAWALVTTFSICSIVLGVIAVRIVARIGGPRSLAAYVFPIVAAFGAFYLIGHRLGIAIGPHIGLYGFQVALPGDLVIGFAAALAAALLQAWLMRATRSGRPVPGTPQPPDSPAPRP